LNVRPSTGRTRTSGVPLAQRRLVHALLDNWFGCAPHTNSIRFDNPELMVDHCADSTGRTRARI